MTARAPRLTSLAATVAAFAIVVITTTFVALPLVAVFTRTSLTQMVDQLATPLFIDALGVSLVSTLIAHALVLAIGTPAAYVLARRPRARGRTLLLGVLELPIVLPPAVAGIALLAAFGRRGLLGGTLDAFGVQLPYTTAAVIIAAMFVSGPIYLRQAVAAFSAIAPDQLDAARTLGASPIAVFWRVAIPGALGGLEAASALALARGFGEFGATIMFAGSIPGQTQTLPLAIYASMNTDFDAALTLGALLITLGVAMLIANRGLARWTRSIST